VAGQRAAALEFHAFTGRDVSGHASVDDDVTRRNAGMDLAVGTDHQFVIAQIDVAFDFAIEIEVFAAAEFAPDHYGLADVPHVSAPFGRRFRRFFGWSADDGRGSGWLRGLRRIQSWSVVFRSCFPHFGTYVLLLLVEVLRFVTRAGILSG